MTSTGPVDGLISGLNTSQIISQLMQLESRPQTDLKNQVSQRNTVISAYQAINTKLAAVRTAAQVFTAPDVLTPTNPTWQSAKATSSSPTVTATASAGAPVGNFSFDVTDLATAQVSAADVTGSAGGPVTTGAGLDITIGGATRHVAVTTDTAQGVADAVNRAKTGITATVVTTKSGGTVLQFTGGTGTKNAFTVTGLQVAPTNIADAHDTELTVGDPTPGHGGYVVSSPTTSVAGVIPNVTLTVTQKTTGVTVNVASDADAIADKMQALVTATNDALSQIATQTANSANVAGGKSGPLAGDLAARQAQQNLLSAVSGGATGYGSFKQVGVQLDRNGKLTFDRAAFLAAYAADPTKTQNGVADGLAKQLDAAAKTASDPTTGTLSTAIQGATTQVRDLNTRITDWDSRLTLRQQALQRQFSALETALGQMKDQSSWLAGQLAGLSGSANS